MATIHDNDGQQVKVVKTFTADDVKKAVDEATARMKKDYEKAIAEEKEKSYKQGFKDGENSAKKSANRSYTFNRNFSGSVIEIRNGAMFVNGEQMDYDDMGNSLGYIGTVEIKGSVGTVKTMSGSVRVDGDIKGDARTMSGSIHCKNVGGDARTMSGSIYKN